ncbi:MAG: lipopolysaccharide transport system ATP-binding protein [Candidatus Azotimanducaceae bacterium]|jgi:lipopolysaccharide transport system ATP-binding protein
MSCDAAIIVSDLSKRYQVYSAPGDRLKQAIFPKMRRLIRLKPVNFFREFQALKPMSFVVGKGETVGIVGRNGSGKSTLLQLICNTLAASSGSCVVKGRIAALLELGSGFNPEYSGRENVQLYGALLGLTSAQMKNKYEEIVQFAGIGDFIDQPVKTYSSGMVVRLAFSVAISVEPEILVVDEALAVGDEVFQRKCFSKIEEIKSAGATILFVSHSGGTVVDLCDRALLLDEGELLLDGVPKFVMEQYHRLIYANKDQAKIVRSELSAVRREGAGKRIESKEERHSGKVEKLDSEELDESFDAHMFPQSSISYELNGGKIRDANLTTLEDRVVNMLVARRVYRFRYVVDIDKRVRGVKFGMMIRNISGQEFGGYATNRDLGADIESVDPGTVCEVCFEFECNLAEGVYFLNAGVLGNHGDGETYLHRIYDVAMFKVMLSADPNATGAIDFKCKPAVLVSK